MEGLWAVSSPSLALSLSLSLSPEVREQNAALPPLPNEERGGAPLDEAGDDDDDDDGRKIFVSLCQICMKCGAATAKKKLKLTPRMEERAKATEDRSDRRFAPGEMEMESVTDGIWEEIWKVPR